MVDGHVMQSRNRIATGFLEKVPTAKVGLAADVIHQHVVDTDVPHAHGEPARHGGDVGNLESVAGMTDEIVADGHIVHYAVRTGVVLIFRRQQNRESCLAESAP